MCKAKKLLCIVVVLGLAGCEGGTSGAGGDFGIIDKAEGTVQITYQVQVPPGASMSDESAWAKERGDTYSKIGKQVVANFYEGSMSESNLKAQCDGNGVCTQY